MFFINIYHSIYHKKVIIKKETEKTNTLIPTHETHKKFDLFNEGNMIEFYG